MNWKRGLFRVWLVASAGWLLFLPTQIPRREIQSLRDVLLAAAFAVVPPVAVWSLGLLAVWIARGFRAADKGIDR